MSKSLIQIQVSTLSVAKIDTDPELLGLKTSTPVSPMEPSVYVQFYFTYLFTVIFDCLFGKTIRILIYLTYTVTEKKD